MSDATSETLIIEGDDTRAEQYEKNLVELHHVRATRRARSEREGLDVLQHNRKAIDQVCLDAILYDVPRALEILRKRLNG